MLGGTETLWRTPVHMLASEEPEVCLNARCRAEVLVALGVLGCLFLLFCYISLIDSALAFVSIVSGHQYGHVLTIMTVNTDSD